MGENGEQILVVDDDPIVLAMMEERLTALGYQVVTREQVLGTSSWVIKHQPWLIVLDLEMPALSGQELAEFLKRKGVDIPLIYHSGKSHAELQELVESTGALGAIKKGLNEAQFERQFNSLVRSIRARKSLAAAQNATSQAPGRRTMTSRMPGSIRRPSVKSG